MKRSFPNILTEEVAVTAAFYKDLLGLTEQFSSEWFVNLVDPDNSGIELGILRQSHEIVPVAPRHAPAGIILTFVVENCDLVYERAQAMKADVLEAPKNMPYGQRRLILKDPAGTIIDISSLIK
ncbi:glyoxalase [Roseibium denhamense]|uniref:VOC domain-containing protein n=1 Tax=Roseibium denhamense TaxID=76305 RepID=A0ABY1NKS6_9HYPH|nr:VOC family protein [Roseibium denhamense]MTI06790.1 glyoxalase [Roseibium denhamense]SMP11359.1 hypothetical protein SAMN06265374_1317 [Roseibium denhamense]